MARRIAKIAMAAALFAAFTTVLFAWLIGLDIHLFGLRFRP
jgi:hypothetical protein